MLPWRIDNIYHGVCWWRCVCVYVYVLKHANKDLQPTIIVLFELSQIFDIVSFIRSNSFVISSLFSIQLSLFYSELDWSISESLLPARLLYLWYSTHTHTHTCARTHTYTNITKHTGLTTHFLRVSFQQNKFFVM